MNLLELIELSSGQCLIIKAGMLFDGTGNPVQKNVTIYIKDQKISSIEPGLTSSPTPDSKSLKQLPSAGNAWEDKFNYQNCSGEIILLDITNCTVLPGMIDCHVHLALDGKDFNGSLEQWSSSEILGERVRKDLRATLGHGIVAVRDGGDLNGIGLFFRNEVAKGSIKGPFIKACGKALGKKGKYGSFLGPGFTSYELDDAVRRMAAEGVDQIKVLVSGVVSFKEYRRVGEIQFTDRELSCIVNTARDMGLKVMAHASSEEAVQAAVRAGVDSVEHGYFLTPESLQAMAGADITWIPTLTPVANQTRAARKYIYSPEQLDVIEKTYRRQQRMLALAREAGVRLGVGTDAGATGVRHGQGYLEELLLYQEAGLSPEEILLAATANGAAALGLEEELGTIRTGMPACLIAVEGNPLNDLNILSNIKYLVLPGTNSGGVI